jgi:hypothetical protein
MKLGAAENVCRPGRRLVAALCARFVVAAGTWSHRLAQQIGDRVPVESELGG